LALQLISHITLPVHALRAWSCLPDIMLLSQLAALQVRAV